MHGCTRPLLVLCLALLAASPARAQIRSLDDPPRILKASPGQADRREALKQYTLGLVCLREDRLLEALKAFEASVKLDPTAAAPYKMQVPLLLALERGPDAVAACKKAAELDPDDHELWAILARMHRSLGRDVEARAALRGGLKASGIKEHPEVAQQLWLDLGGLHESAGEFAEAADAFHKAAELLDRPDAIAEHGPFTREDVLAKAAETYERIGNLYRKAKRYEQAAQAYATAQQRAPARAGRLHFNLAELFRDLGEHPKALAHADAYLRLQPMGMEAYELKIGLLAKLDRPQDVVPWLEKAAKEDRHNVALQMLLAREYARAKMVAQAEQAYLALARSSPSTEVYTALFRLHQADTTTGMAKVLDAVDKAVEKAAAKEEPGAGVARARAMVLALRSDAELGRAAVLAAAKSDDLNLKFETLHLLAVLADKHRLYAEAERFYRRCLPHVSRANEALVYGGLLRVLGRLRKHEETIAVCEQGLENAQATSQVLLLTDLARAQAALDRFDEALRSTDRAHQLAPDDQKLFVRHLRVRVLLMADRHDDAEAECHALLKEYTKTGEALEIRYLLSGVYSATKQTEKSEEQLRIILEADPDNATANNDLGYHWADQNKNLAEAEAMIRRALDSDRRRRQDGKTAASPDDDNASYVDSLGWVLFRRGRVAEARKELERAAKLPDGEDPVIWEHLGEVYQHLDQPADARRAYEQALRLYDQGRRRRTDERYREVQRRLEELRGRAEGR